MTKEEKTRILERRKSLSYEEFKKRLEFDEREIFPGTRVLVFDPRLSVDDVKTPLTTTMQPATVLRRYGYKTKPDFMTETGWTYPDVVDVRFDHDGRESRGHFTYGVEVIDD